MGQKRKCNKRVAEGRLKQFFDNLTIDCNATSSSDSAKEFAVNRLLQRMRKRAEVDNPALHSKAIKDFKILNASLEGKTCTPNDAYEHAADFIRHVLEKCMKRMYPDSLQECFPRSFILDNWRFGPGTSNGIEGIGTVQKIDSYMKCTSQAEPYVLQIRRECVYFRAYDGLDNYPESLTTPFLHGSRLSTVIKNESAVRTIAIEPPGNMALQLSAGHFIEEVLAMLGFDITSQQPKNQNMARIGSLLGTFFTMDLKSASDMQSCDLMRRLWPAQWYEFFMQMRSPSTKLPGGEIISLNMISTMGNGFTFPMMTLSILALIYANRLLHHNGPYRFIDSKKTAVFGDDIIAPTAEYETLSALLTDAGYVINHDKSYVAGPFRESCGGDYYKGVNVTPFYVKHLRRPSDIYVAINQVLAWSGRHEIPLVRSLKFLFGLLRTKVLFVPEWSDDTAGVKTSQCPREYKMLQTIPTKLTYEGRYSMMLVCGGFLLEGDDGALVYQPRETWVTYRAGTAKLPDGYLDGWDPRYGTLQQSNYRSLLVNIVR